MADVNSSGFSCMLWQLCFSAPVHLSNPAFVNLTFSPDFPLRSLNNSTHSVWRSVTNPSLQIPSTYMLVDLSVFMQMSSHSPIIHTPRVVWVARPFIIQCEKKRKKKSNFRKKIVCWSMPYTSLPPFSLRSTEHIKSGPRIFQDSAFVVCCLIHQILQTVLSGSSKCEMNY